MSQQRNAPYIASKQAALTDGLKEYQGKPCKKCGSTLRDIRFGCVPCKAKYFQNPKVKARRAVAIVKVRARRMQAEGSYTTKEWLELKKYYGNRCLRCHKHESELTEVLEQDHVIPLSKGGSNWITNIQPLCGPCNGMGGKGTKDYDYRPTFEIRRLKRLAA